MLYISLAVKKYLVTAAPITLLYKGIKLRITLANKNNIILQSDKTLLYLMNDSSS